jgi:uncharacterized protein (TIGR02246 family)
MSTGIATADQTAIAGAPQRLVAAWAARDAAAFAALFTEDGTMILPGVYRKGRPDISAYMAYAFATIYRDTRVTGRPIDLKPIGSDAVALITEGGVIAPGETQLSPAATIRASWILVKRDGEWQVAVYHNCPRDPA